MMIRRSFRKRSASTTGKLRHQYIHPSQGALGCSNDSFHASLRGDVSGSENGDPAGGSDRIDDPDSSRAVWQLVDRYCVAVCRQCLRDSSSKATARSCDESNARGRIRGR